LLAGGLHPDELVVFGGAPTSSVAFGGYELLSTSPPVCAWGSVSVKSVEVDSGGITREGGCLESAGATDWQRPVTGEVTSPVSSAHSVFRIPLGISCGVMDSVRGSTGPARSGQRQADEVDAMGGSTSSMWAV
jgi:hypothetical protein